MTTANYLNKKLRLKSWKGDYLHRPDQPQGVTTWNTGIGNEWIIESSEGGKVQLKSWKGDFLHRPDQPQGVTTWNTGIGNQWEIEPIEGGKVQLKSWKGDFLHRPDQPQGVTTWNTGIGNQWEIELVDVVVVGKVEITNVAYKGQVKHVQSDEYVEITNNSNVTVDVSGWKLTSAHSDKQVFIFPVGASLASGQSIRVYTNEVHHETGGFSFASPIAIWHDKGDEAKLFDTTGQEISVFSYSN